MCLIKLFKYTISNYASTRNSLFVAFKDPWNWRKYQIIFLNLHSIYSSRYTIYFCLHVRILRREKTSYLKLIAFRYPAVLLSFSFYISSQFMLLDVSISVTAIESNSDDGETIKTLWCHLILVILLKIVKSYSTKMCRYDWMRNYWNSWWHNSTTADEFKEGTQRNLISFSFLEFIWEWEWSQQRTFFKGMKINLFQ